MRRAESCDHQRSGFEMEALPLDSIAQVSGRRLCFDLSVYMNVLQRIQKITAKALDVYLATDDAGSVID
jgi:hypothetical protein